MGDAVNVKFIHRVDSFWRGISFRILPGSCILCGAGSNRDADFCVDCEHSLPQNPKCCSRCALPLATSEKLCGRCLKSPPEFDSVHAFYRYEWPLDGLLTRFKFSGDLAAGRSLAELVTTDLATAIASGVVAKPDLLMPVPLHIDRLRERGFNQALELARPWSECFYIPLHAEGLCRARATAAQSNLDALARRRNVRGAFVVNMDVRNRHIAVVDDVVTTAATVRECAKVLKREGAASVQIWAVARAPAPKN